jgi:hypothetical protein
VCRGAGGNEKRKLKESTQRRIGKEKNSTPTNPATHDPHKIPPNPTTNPARTVVLGKEACLVGVGDHALEVVERALPRALGRPRAAAAAASAAGRGWRAASARRRKESLRLVVERVEAAGGGAAGAAAVARGRRRRAGGRRPRRRGPRRAAGRRGMRLGCRALHLGRGGRRRRVRSEGRRAANAERGFTRRALSSWAPWFL